MGVRAQKSSLPLKRAGNDYFIALPFLVKGEIEYPPDVGESAIRDAFRNKANETGCQPTDITHIKMENAQVLREPIINRQTMTDEDAFFYQVMPKVDPFRVGYFHPSVLADELCNLPFEDVLSYLGRLSKLLSSGGLLAKSLRDAASLSSNIPRGFFELSILSLGLILNPVGVAQTLDKGLAYLGHDGREFLDGWVEVPMPSVPGAAMLNAGNIFKDAAPNTRLNNLQIRAMPTRQLHITAGNATGIPFISVMRSFATKSASLIKMPYGVTIPGALLGLAMVEAGADHPLTKNTSIVYWAGGDAEIENAFYEPGFFDRIIVWGAPEAVKSVKGKALHTRVLTFNPRYALSFIGKEAFPDHLEEVVVKASTDSMIENQKACIASLVHYVEGTEEEALKYAETLAGVMKRWDAAMPNYSPPFITGRIRKLRRGKLAGSRWFPNYHNGQFQSAVIYVDGQMDMMDHPMWRVIIVRRVDSLEDCLKYLRPEVSTVGIYPEERRIALRDHVAARGVSNVVPLGQNERFVLGAPHDGMMVFSELVDWKNA